jgi:hypothetical protein
VPIKTLNRLFVALAISSVGVFPLGQSFAGATRTIEEAANSLLTEALASLNLQITNQELLLELSYEIQYALDTEIIEQITIDDLDVEVLIDEIPDEELFEEEDDSESPDTKAPPRDSAQLSVELTTRLRNRFTQRLAEQVKYWEIIATDWATASELTTQEFEKCITAATTDEESDTCYFNELQQLQIYYAQELANSYSLRLSSATSLGPEIVAMLQQSFDRAKDMIQEILSFLNAEELALLGFTSATLGDIAKRLDDSSLAPLSSEPPYSNQQNGGNP